MMLLEQLAVDHVHFTAEELFTHLKPNLPGLSVATVYKNLEDLSKAGLIREIRLNGQNRRFELDRGDHIHLISGKKIVDILDQNLLKDIKERLQLKIGPEIDIETIEIQIFGDQKKQN